MKKLMLCAVGLAMFSNVANAAICKDFDDDMNLVEYECGTSLDAAIKANKAKIEKQKLQAEIERKAQAEAEKLEKERLAAERAAEKARKEAEKKVQAEAEKLEKERLAAERAAEKARKEAERKKKKDAERLEQERISAERATKKAKKEAERATKKAKKEAERKAKKEARIAERKRLKAELQAANVSVPVWDRIWWKWLHFDPFVGFELQYHVTDKKYRMDDGIYITNPSHYENSFQVGLMVLSEYSDDFLFARYEIGLFGRSYDINGGLSCGLECVKNGGMQFSNEDTIHLIDFGWGTKLYKSFNGYAGFGIGYHNSSFHKKGATFHTGDMMYPGGWVEHYDEDIKHGGTTGKMFVGLEYKLFNWLRVYTEPTVIMLPALKDPLFYVSLGGKIVF